MARLDFLVVGAQKCATSWLYYCLHDHPQLHLPPGKREVEYLGGPRWEEHGGEEGGTDWYLGLLDGAAPGQRVGDVSVHYLFDPAAPERVQAVAPEVKLVASLREPVERAVSAYFWAARKGVLPEGLTLDEAVRRVLEDWERDPAPHRDRMPGDRLRDLLERGFYDLQLARWRDRFGPERLAFLLYDDVAAAPEREVQRLFAFLGVDASFVPPSLARRPKRNSYSLLLLRLERLAPRSRVVAGVANVANQVLARRPAAERPQLDAGLARALRDVYRPHVARTQQMLEAATAPRRPPHTDLLDRWGY